MTLVMSLLPVFYLQVNIFRVSGKYFPCFYGKESMFSMYFVNNIHSKCTEKKIKYQQINKKCTKAPEHMGFGQKEVI